MKKNTNSFSIRSDDESNMQYNRDLKIIIAEFNKLPKKHNDLLC